MLSHGLVAANFSVVGVVMQSLCAVQVGQGDSVAAGGGVSC